jgi:hypothetical protein
VRPSQYVACHWSEEITPAVIEAATRASDPVKTAEPVAAAVEAPAG